MKTRLESYARAIVDLWSASQQRAIILSPREWNLICGWFAREIPLQVVADAIEGLRERGRRVSSRPRSLSYLAPAVEESWTTVVNGRIDSGVDRTERPVAPTPRATWLAAAERYGPATPLGQLLGTLLAAAAQGVDAEEIERRLIDELPATAPRELVEELRGEIAGQTASFRERLQPSAVEAIARRALIERLRGRIGLPGWRETGRPSGPASE